MRHELLAGEQTATAARFSQQIMVFSPIRDVGLVGRLFRAAGRGAAVPKALLGLGALVGVGLATVGLEILLDRLLGWPVRDTDETETPQR